MGVGKKALSRADDQVRREAAAWFARLRGPNASVLQAEFDQWRGGRPDRQAAYDRLLQRWDDAAVLSMSRADLGLGVNSARRYRRRSRFALGALMAAAAGVGIYFAPIRPDWVEAWPVPSAWSQRLATPVGEIRTVKLPDGSSVTLDTGAILRWRFSSSIRRLVLLRGRARFAVAHDPARPFLVAAGGGEVTAHGTLFDVSLTSNRNVRVALLQGSVEVRPPADAGRVQPTRLTPGQELAFGQDLPLPRLRPLAPASATWPSGMLTFADTPIGQAVAEANRYSRIPLRLGSPDLAQLRVSGAYHAGPARAFADSLAAAFDLRVRTAPDGALILDGPAASHGS